MDRDRAVAGWSARSGSVSQSREGVPAADEALHAHLPPLFLQVWAMFARGRGAQQGRGSQRRRQLYSPAALPRSSRQKPTPQFTIDARSPRNIASQP